MSVRRVCPCSYPVICLHIVRVKVCIGGYLHGCIAFIVLLFCCACCDIPTCYMFTYCKGVRFHARLRVCLKIRSHPPHDFSTCHLFFCYASHIPKRHGNTETACPLPPPLLPLYPRPYCVSTSPYVHASVPARFLVCLHV